MRKTFNIIGAAVLGAAVIFGADSCKSSETKASAEQTEPAVETVATDSTAADCAAGAIVYVDVARILQGYQDAIDLSEQAQAKLEEMAKVLNNKQSTYEKEMKKKTTNYETKVKDFEDKYSKGHLTETAAQVKYQEIATLENEIRTYAAQQEEELYTETVNLQAAEESMMNEILSRTLVATSVFAQTYRAEKGYAMIIMTQGGDPVLAADPSLDITDAVLAGLNAEYNEVKK